MITFRIIAGRIIAEIDGHRADLDLYEALGAKLSLDNAIWAVREGLTDREADEPVERAGTVALGAAGRA